MNVFVKQYDQKPTDDKPKPKANLSGMFSLSEHRGKTCFYHVERRIENRGAKATQND